MTARAFGALVALIAFALDQASKALVLWVHAQGVEEPFALAPMLDFTLRWNHGVSFSLFAQDTPQGRAMLVGFTVLAIVLLGLWLWRSRSRLVAFGLGAIIGGAFGNLLDRLVHGAVVDFLDLHAFGRHFFVFNGADAAINLGVALLVVDALFVSGRPANAAGASGPRAS